MDEDLAFREARIGWRAVVGFALAGIGLYAAASYFGNPVIYSVAGITSGYLFARLTKF